jgi:hypothetical protein
VGWLELARALNVRWARPGHSRQASWTYLDAESYGFYSYIKPELTLGTLERILGEEVMARIMRAYQERWRFGHPSSDDFYAVANSVSGQDLTAFFRQTIEGNDVLDYEVSSVATEEMHGSTAGGVTDDPDAERPDAPPVAGVEYESSVVIRRLGGVTVPVEIAFTFEGQPPERLTWDGRDEWRKFTFRRPHRLEWVQLDPDRRLLLDVSWLNNARRVQADHRVATKWTARWFFWLQNVLRLVGV